MHPRRALGPALVVVLVAIPVVLWATAAPLGPRFGDLSTSLTNLGVAFGLAGVSAFAVNLVLGARIGFADLLFTSGGFVVIYGIVAFIGMAIAIGMTLYKRLSHEGFIYVQRTFGVIFLIASMHVFMTPGIKASSRPLTIYRSVFGNLLVRRHDYLVTGARRLDRWVVEITMTPKAGKPFTYFPGQFVFVTFFSNEFEAQFHPVSIEHEGEYAIVTLRPGQISNQFHPFSLTSAPGEKNLRIAVKAVGD